MDDETKPGPVVVTFNRPAAEEEACEVAASAPPLTPGNILRGMAEVERNCSEIQREIGANEGLISLACACALDVRGAVDRADRAAKHFASAFLHWRIARELEEAATTCEEEGTDGAETLHEG